MESQNNRSYTSLAKLSTSAYKPRYMAETVSCRMKQIDDEYKSRAAKKQRYPKKQKLLRTPLLTQSYTMNNNLMAENNPRQRTPHYWQSPSQPSTLLPPDYELLPRSRNQYLRLGEVASVPEQLQESRAYAPNSAANQLPRRRLSANRYKPKKPNNKGSMFSFNVNKQISEKFGLRHDSLLKVTEQPMYRGTEDRGSPAYHNKYSKQSVQPILPNNRTVVVERPVEVRSETSPSVKDVLKKLNEKVNKLYSWQMSELDLVARLAGEIQALKRPTKRAPNTPISNSDTQSENLVSTKLGKMLLRTLSKSLQKIVSEVPEESRESPLSPDNLTSLKKEIERLSSSLRATALKKEKVQIVETHNAMKSPQLKKRSIDEKTPRPLPQKSRRLQMNEPQMTKTDTKLERLTPQNFDAIGIPPARRLSVSRKQGANHARQQEPQNIPPEVGCWIGDLKDEITTAKMTLSHVMELTTDPRGQSTQRFKDFVLMIGNCHMLQPFMLPDACTKWLVNASKVQVAVIQELTQLLQTVKQFIKSLVEEKDLDDIRNIHRAIQGSCALDQRLPSLTSSHTSED